MPQTVILTLLLSASFLLAYWGTLTQTIRTWFSFQHSHGPLILAVSLYLLWIRRHRLRGIPSKPNIGVGAPFAVLGCLLVFLGEVSSTLLFQQVSLVVMLLGLAWLTRGSEFGRAAFLPIIYLLFMSGLFDEALGNASLHFQLAGACIATWLLALTGMPVFLTAQYIHLPHMTLEVARACNGINHIVALVALAVPLAWLTQSTWVGRGILVLCSLALGVFLNGLRVALIGIWAALDPSGPTHGPLELFYASFIFFLGMILLVGLSSLISRSRLTVFTRGGGAGSTPERTEPLGEPSDPGPAGHPADALGQPPGGAGYGRALSRGAGSADSGKPAVSWQDVWLRTSGVLATCLAVILLSATGVVTRLCKPEPVFLTSPLEAFPRVIAGWEGEDVGRENGRFKGFCFDDAIERVYSDGSGHRMRLYMGYIAAQDQEKKLVSFRHDQLHHRACVIEVALSPSQAIRINQSRTELRAGSRETYFWYEIDGGASVDRYTSKLTVLLRAVTKRKTNGAMIILQPESDGNPRGMPREKTLEFIRAVIPAIRASLSDVRIG